MLVRQSCGREYVTEDHATWWCFEHAFALFTSRGAALETQEHLISNEQAVPNHKQLMWEEASTPFHPSQCHSVNLVFLPSHMKSFFFFFFLFSIKRKSWWFNLLSSTFLLYLINTCMLNFTLPYIMLIKMSFQLTAQQWRNWVYKKSSFIDLSPPSSQCASHGKHYPLFL